MVLNMYSQQWKECYKFCINLVINPKTKPNGSTREQSVTEYNSLGGHKCLCIISWYSSRWDILVKAEKCESHFTSLLRKELCGHQSPHNLGAIADSSNTAGTQTNTARHRTMLLASQKDQGDAQEIRLTWRLGKKVKWQKDEIWNI